MPFETIREFWTARIAAGKQDASNRRGQFDQAQAALVTARTAVADATRARNALGERIATLKAQLGTRPMPADSDALVEQWGAARFSLQQAEVDLVTAKHRQAEAESAVTARRDELADADAEVKLAESAEAAAKAQVAAIKAISDKLTGAGFAVLPASAATLLGNPAQNARARLDEAVPAVVREIVAKRHAQAAATAELANRLRLSTAQDTLGQHTSAAGALVASAAATLMAARDAFAAWAAIDPVANPGPATEEQRQRLADVTAAHQAGLDALLLAETALLARDEAEAALEARVMAGRQPAESQDQFAQAVTELADKLREQRQAYTDAVTAEATAASAALAELPDQWLAATLRHEELTASLRAIAQPLGQNTPSLAQAQLEADVTAVRDAIQAAVKARDDERAAARQAAADRQRAELLLAKLGARATGPVGGLYPA